MLAALTAAVTAAAVRPASGAVPAAAAGRSARPFRIYAITFRGLTEVEKGFSDHFSHRKIPVDIIHRDLNRDASRMPGFLAEIHATRPDLVYTWGTSVTLGVTGPFDAVQPGLHITDIPVVFTLVASPTLAKIVPLLNAPGRNITGVTHVGSTAAQIRAMAQYRRFKTLGVLYTPTEKNSLVVVDEIRQLARARGFRLVERHFKLDSAGKPSAQGAAELVRELKAAGAEWLYLPPDSFLGTLADTVVIPAAMQQRLPSFASTEQLMQAGAMSGLVSRYYNVGQFTAHKAEQILVGGRSPGSIPVETLTRLSYQINMSAARHLNLPPPLSMLSHAELMPG